METITDRNQCDSEIIGANLCDDNDVGRFISPDPVKQGENYYIYCDNNPTTNIDPTGLEYLGSTPKYPSVWEILTQMFLPEVYAKIKLDRALVAYFSQMSYTHSSSEEMIQGVFKLVGAYFTEVMSKPSFSLKIRISYSPTNSALDSAVKDLGSGYDKPGGAPPSINTEPDLFPGEELFNWTPEEHIARNLTVPSGNDGFYTQGNFNVYPFASGLSSGGGDGRTDKKGVYSINDGKVMWVLKKGPYGNRIYVKHSDKTMVMYGHLKSTLVKKGDTVNAGQQIGIMGKSGTDNVHLHVSFWNKPVSKYDSGTTTNGLMKYIKSHHAPSNTMATNPYGSSVHHKDVSSHEGIDFSGNQMVSGWQSGLSGGFWATANFYNLMPK